MATPSTKSPVPADPGEAYRATKDTHRLCKRCQFVMTANEDQVCDSCAGHVVGSDEFITGEFGTTPDEKYENSNTDRLVHYAVWSGERRTLMVKAVDGKGEVEIPYLTWVESEDGRLSLTLDRRLGLDLPVMTQFQQDSIVEFIANCIAVGAGYASIYYTKRKMPFRG